MQIEGRNSVLETLYANKKVDIIYIEQGAKVEDIVHLAQNKHIRVEYLKKADFSARAKTPKPQGVIAIIEDYKYCALDDIIKDDGFIVLLDSIEDPYNLGSIIRTCECAGVDGIVIPKHRSASINETVFKTSAGAVNHIKICRVGSLNDAIDYLKDKGYFIFATAMDGQLAKETNLKGKIGIVIGNEGNGVHRLTREKCDGTIKIQMYGRLNSLNASVACGIVLFQALEQRH